MSDPPSFASTPTTLTGNLELNLFRAALVVAGVLPPPRAPLAPEPPMDLREVLGRAMHLRDIQLGLCGERVTFEEWFEGLGEAEVDAYLNALVLVVAPPAAGPS
jgi:hypothetical protein